MKIFPMHLKEVSRLTHYDLSCVGNAINFIDKNYSDHISADQLSLEVGLSKKKLQAGIRQKTGLTLHGYILQIRIEKSKPLLADTGLPLKAIARTIGFKTCSHFCKIFKNLTSNTPMEYRLQHAY